MWSDFQNPGDILFTSSPGLGGKLNLLAQKFLTGRKTKATHVILCIAPGLYIHSNKGRGVEFDKAEDFPLDVSPKTGRRYLCRAIRPQESTSVDFVELMNKALFFYQQKYNPFFFAKNRLTSNRYKESAAFCSEFVSAVYRNAGLALTELEDEKVFPSTLESHLSGPDWVDVTEEYIRGLTEANAARDKQPFFEPLRDAVFQTLKVNISLIMLTAMNNQMGGDG